MTTDHPTTADLDTISVEVKRLIISQEIAGYEQERYRLELRARVAQRLSNREALGQATKELEQIERILDILREERALIEATP